MNARTRTAAPVSGEFSPVPARPPVLRRSCACGGSAGPAGKCTDCAERERFGAGSSVTLGASGDRFEAEADRIADRVMNSPAPALQRMGDERIDDEEGILQRQPGAMQRMEPEEEEEEMLQRQAANTAAPAPAAVSSAATAVAAGGQPLPPGERSFFESRLGRDLSRVRIHNDAAAQRAARGIHARAYTLRNHIAFAPGQFSPGTAHGRRLMAHEITHTIQQGADQMLRRAVCTPSAICSGGPVPGSAEEFDEGQSAEEAGPRSRRQGMTPARARSTGHAGRARQLEIFFHARNPALMGEVHGIFLDADMGSGTDAITMSCSDFLADSLPSGDPDPDNFATATQDCVFVRGTLNRQALQFNRGSARVGGQSRTTWARETEALLTHEATHAFFEGDIEPVLPPPAGITTATCTDAAVTGELSEIVSILVEFPFFFDAAEAEANPSGPAHRRLTQYFDTYMDTTEGESWPGALAQMGCECSCTEVDAYVVGRVDTMTAGFSNDQKNALRTELQSRMPSGSRPSWPDTPTP